MGAVGECGRGAAQVRSIWRNLLKIHVLDDALPSYPIQNFLPLDLPVYFLAGTMVAMRLLFPIFAQRLMHWVTTQWHIESSTVQASSWTASLLIHVIFLLEDHVSSLC